MKIIPKTANHDADLQRIFLEVRRKTFDWLDIETFETDDFEKEAAGEFIFSGYFG